MMGYRTLEISSSCEIHIKEGQFSLAKELNLTHSTFYRYVKEIHEKSEGD